MCAVAPLPLSPSPFPTAPLPCMCVWVCRYQQLFCSKHFLVAASASFLPRHFPQMSLGGVGVNVSSLCGAKCFQWATQPRPHPLVCPSVSCRCTLAAHKYLIMWTCQLAVRLSDFPVPSAVTARRRLPLSSPSLLFFPLLPSPLISITLFHNFSQFTLAAATVHMKCMRVSTSRCNRIWRWRPRQTTRHNLLLLLSRPLSLCLPFLLFLPLLLSLSLSSPCPYPSAYSCSLSCSCFSLSLLTWPLIVLQTVRLRQPWL